MGRVHGLLLVLGVLATGCAPMRFHASYAPEAPGGRAFAVACAGGVGPREVLVVSGPREVRVLALVRPEPEQPRAWARVGVHAPRGVQVRLVDGALLLEDPEGALRVEQPLTHVREVTGDYSEVYRPHGGIDTLEGRAPPRPFHGVVRGTQAEGTFAWFELTWEGPRPARLRLWLPELEVEGEPFAPGPVELRYAGPAWGVVPLNC